MSIRNDVKKSVLLFVSFSSLEGGNFIEKLDISLYWNFTLRYKIYIRVELCIGLQLSRKRDSNIYKCILFV